MQIQQAPVTTAGSLTAPATSRSTYVDRDLGQIDVAYLAAKAPYNSKLYRSTFQSQLPVDLVSCRE